MADLLVLAHGARRAVERHVVDVHAVLGEERVAGALDRVHDGVVDTIDDVSLAVVQGRDTGRVLSDEAEDDVLRLRCVVLVPVVVVCDELDILALVPRDELVGASADRVLHEAGRILLEDSRACDRCSHRHGKVLDERSRGRSKRDLHRVVSVGLDGLDAVSFRSRAEREGSIGHIGRAARALELALDALLHGLGVEVGAVVELHALLQAERVGQAVVGDAVVRSELRHDVGRLVAVDHEVLVDVLHDLCGLAVVDVGRIEATRIGALCERDRVGGTRRAAGARSIRGTLAAAARKGECAAGAHDAHHLDEGLPGHFRFGHTHGDSFRCASSPQIRAALPNGRTLD